MPEFSIGQGHHQCSKDSSYNAESEAAQPTRQQRGKKRPKRNYEQSVAGTGEDDDYESYDVGKTQLSPGHR